MRAQITNVIDIGQKLVNEKAELNRPPRDLEEICRLWNCRVCKTKRLKYFPFKIFMQPKENKCFSKESFNFFFHSLIYPPLYFAWGRTQIWNHPYTYVRKMFRKTNICYLLISTRTYQEVRNVSLSRNLAYVLNKWCLWKSFKPSLSVH